MSRATIEAVLARLEYRARTKATAAWMSAGMEWSEWAERYKTAEAEAKGLAADVDFNGRSTEHQRKINGRSTMK